MKPYFLDLHVHIGRSGDGKPVKITASPDLTLRNILVECREKKGIELVGIVDCSSTGVLADLREMVRTGELTALAGGGFCFRDRITLFTGVELETKEPSGGRAHYLSFFPTLEHIERFARFVALQVKNPQLSTQACYLPALQLMEAVLGMGGIFIPAHAFTPHKSLFGSCAASLREVFGARSDQIKALELGLSADSGMAALLPNLRELTFFSNSDAHSLDKIGREYNRVMLDEPDFQELVYLVRRKKGRKILGNYGLDPRLGKYHRSFCNRCKKSLIMDGPVLKCPFCGEERDFVRGVLDRIMHIAGSAGDTGGQYTVPYYYQVPLTFLPGVGKRTIRKLIERFGSEMAVLHEAEYTELAEAAGTEAAAMIMRARRGQLKYVPGAGGIYGRISRG